MKLLNEFTVAAPMEQTWATLLDVERVASCLPGATIEPAGEDGAHKGGMKMKVGPVSMSYSGTVRVADVDEDTHTASFDARAKETRGTGTASAMITNRLESVGAATKVFVETDLNVTGRPAQFGRGMMEDVASKLLAEFAKRLERLIVDGPAVATPGTGQATAAPSGQTTQRPQPSVPADEEAEFDMGSLLIKGYARQIGIGAVVIAVLAALIWRGRRPRGFAFTVRYRP